MSDGQGTPNLVLASASRARRELLEAAGLSFAVRPAAVDEAGIKEAAQAESLPAEEAAIALAEMKARRICRAEPQAVVIGADQILICDGRWFDKPGTPEEARAQLLALRGREHVLATAVLCARGGRRLWHHIARPRLWMRPFSDEFLDDYLAREGDAVCSSVGAYRLEGRGIQLFDRVEGEHATILGLPLLPLLGFLRQSGSLAA